MIISLIMEGDAGNTLYSLLRLFIHSFLVLVGIYVVTNKLKTILVSLTNREEERSVTRAVTVTCVQ